jgi:hypothetical protein
MNKMIKLFSKYISLKPTVWMARPIQSAGALSLSATFMSFSTNTINGGTYVSAPFTHVTKETVPSLPTLQVPLHSCPLSWPFHCASLAPL